MALMRAAAPDGDRAMYVSARAMWRSAGERSGGARRVREGDPVVSPGAMGVLVGVVGSIGQGRRRGEPVEGLVWLVGVVLGSPVLERDLGFEEVGEVFGVEAFVSQASVEGLDVGGQALSVVATEFSVDAEC